VQAHIEVLLPEGEALARTEQHGSFRMRHAIPGDEVSIEPSEKKRGIAYATIQHIVTPSPLRIEPACPVAQICGGCALQMLSPPAHATIKSAWVEHAFHPAISEQTEWIPAEAADMQHASFLRRRVRWHVQQQGSAVVLGFRGFQSHAVIATSKCMVVTDALNHLRQCLETTLSEVEASLPESVYAVQLEDGIHVVVEYEKKTFTPPVLSDTAMPTVQWWQRSGKSLKPLNRPVFNLHDLLPTARGTVAIQVGPEDFVQGQKHGNHQIIQQLLTWCQGERYVVDLFSGVGNLSLPLAASGMQILGAEVNDASVRVANANAKRLKLSASYQQADLFQRFDITPFVGADLLLIDPPRKGARHICRLLPRLLPKKLILIHCDVASAKIDAQEILSHGYRLKSLKALDLFPFSGHVESMSLWEL